MNNFEFFMPVRIYFGRGQTARLGEETAKYSNRALLVYGGGSIKRSGLYDEIKAQFLNKDIKLFELGGVEPNPRIGSIRKGVELCRKEGIGFILAAGGGSTLDCAKAIAAGTKYEGDPWDFFIKRANVEDALPLGDILTLAAAGSEANGNCVVSNPETRQKLVISSPMLYPKFSILDPVYTTSVPKDQTAYGIVDIFTHVTEQYFSLVDNTPLQDRMAEGILKTLVESAYAVVRNPEDYDARANIMWCGTCAASNFIIGKGKVPDWACHVIEHEVSALFDIAHGAGLAALFPRWAEHVVSVSENIDKFVQFAIRVWEVNPAGKSGREIAMEGVRRTQEFFGSLDMPENYDNTGMTEEDLGLMLERLSEKGPKGNYYKLGRQDIEAILRKSFLSK